MPPVRRRAAPQMASARCAEKFETINALQAFCGTDCRQRASSRADIPDGLADALRRLGMSPAGGERGLAAFGAVCRVPTGGSGGIASTGLSLTRRPLRLNAHVSLSRRHAWRWRGGCADRPPASIAVVTPWWLKTAPPLGLRSRDVTIVNGHSDHALCPGCKPRRPRAENIEGSPDTVRLVHLDGTGKDLKVERPKLRAVSQMQRSLYLEQIGMATTEEPDGEPFPEPPPAETGFGPLDSDNYKEWLKQKREWEREHASPCD